MPIPKRSHVILYSVITLIFWLLLEYVSAILVDSIKSIFVSLLHVALG